MADSIQGRLGIAVTHLESGEAVAWQGSERFPMQSVYKFPIAMFMLQRVDVGAFALGDTVTVQPAEMIPKAGHSPLRDQYPNGVHLSIQQLIEYNVAQSDGTACDVLLRLLGGTAGAQAMVARLGIDDVNIATTEMLQVANDTIQYQNWATPIGMNQLLKVFWAGQYLSESSQRLLQTYMKARGPWFVSRLRGLLPEATVVAHKTGSSRTYNGLTRATNDAGIITLPDDTHLAITVFLADCTAEKAQRDLTIARVARAAFDYFLNKKD